MKPLETKLLKRKHQYYTITKDIRANHFSVWNDSLDYPYYVITGESPECDCPHFKLRLRSIKGAKCKHILMAEEAEGGHS